MIPALKGLHLIMMAATLIMYVARGVMLATGSPQLDRALIRMAPYLIDGLLIVSALGAAVAIGWYPFVNAWVTAKLLGTLAYLGLAHAGFGRRDLRVYGMALLPVIYVLAVVACRDPLACFGTF